MTENDFSRLMLSSRGVATLLKSTCGNGASFKFTAKGFSMSPFICSGDSLLIGPIPNKKTLSEGDIVALVTPEEGRLIIHRIIKKKKDYYLLKGDNVYHNDGYHKQENIHGCLQTIIMAARYDILYKLIRNSFLFFNNFKIVIAFLSRYKILTPICRLTNKLLNGKLR